ncbi:X-Pro dipeptidyl-peptidase [Nakamurella sp. UYEF19]|uniref:CocE/NonD family hydrolase n=1 Tax=Nakamurella sp. UYEF19 TaxID=1756392 RepID=UPI0033974A3B
MIDLKRDLDRDGKDDVISVDIVRPRTSGRVPVIMEQSPYYDGAGRGSLSQRKVRNTAGVVVGMPLFYDNYFVPRGYAFAAMDSPGQGRSTGCGDFYGPADRAAVSAVLDWLGGSRTATSDAGQAVSATWSSGRVGMIGKSADGADALTAAATGNPALKTVVSIEGLVDLFPLNSTAAAEPMMFFPQVDGTQRGWNPACDPFNAVMTTQQNAGGVTYNQFFRDRNGLESIGKWRAATFIVTGLRDLVAPANESLKLWEALGARKIPRKLWLTQGGHADPFDLRRAQWVDTLHAWFDRYLLDLPSGIETAPAVTVQNADLSWRDQSIWPAPPAPQVFRFSGQALEPKPPVTSPPTALGTIVAPAGLSATAVNDLLDPLYDPKVASAGPGQRVLLLTAPLVAPLRLSGRPQVILPLQVVGSRAQVVATVVDYGTGNRVATTDDLDGGLVPAGGQDCWGQSAGRDSACYPRLSMATRPSKWGVLSSGVLDLGLNSAGTARLPIAQRTWLTAAVPMKPVDLLIPAGHRIGLLLTMSDTFGAPPPDGEQLTIGSTGSLTLPVTAG